jgi:hypothetical protein
MAFADSNRVGLRYVEESVYASTPAGPDMQELNFTSESLKSNVNTVTSETIRSDRNVSDITQVGGGAGGDIGFEMRYADIEPLIAGAMQTSWVTTAVSTTVAVANFSAASIDADSSALNHVVEGQFLRVRNATTTANDGDYRVTGVATVNGSTTTIQLADASSGAAASFTSEVFAAGTSLVGRHIRNGTTPKSFTVEKEFADVSSFAQYAGMRVTALSLNFESQAILTGTIGFVGKSQATSSATVASTTTAATTNKVMNASGNVARIWEGGQAIAGVCFQSLSLDVNNNPREQTKVGSDALAGVGTGRCEISGAVTAYFENNALIDKFTNGTKSNFRFQTTDLDGNSYVIDLPLITYTDFTIAAGGGNQDVVQDGTWGASIDSNGVYSIQIDALDA